MKMIATCNGCGAREEFDLPPAGDPWTAPACPCGAETWTVDRAVEVQVHIDEALLDEVRPRIGWHEPAGLVVPIYAGSFPAMEVDGTPTRVSLAAVELVNASPEGKRLLGRIEERMRRLGQPMEQLAAGVHTPHHLAAHAHGTDEGPMERCAAEASEHAMDAGVYLCPEPPALARAFAELKYDSDELCRAGRTGVEVGRSAGLRLALAELARMREEYYGVTRHALDELRKRLEALLGNIPAEE